MARRMRKMLTTIVQMSKNKYIEQETGYLICENAVLGSTGVQEYYAGDLDIEDLAPQTRVKVYRPAEEVFKAESLASLENKAFTVLHPDENVTAENDHILRKGSVYNVRREGDVIVGDIQITDKDTIEKTKYIKCLSLGYNLDLDRMDGEETSFIARNIRYNHLALVPKGRSKVAQINDAIDDKNKLKGESYMSLFGKKNVPVADADLDEDKDKNTDKTADDAKDTDKDEENAKANDECTNATDAETETEKDKVEKRDEREGAEEDTVTKEIEKRVAKGDYTQKDLEKLLEKLKKGDKKEIENDYNARKDEEKDKKGKDSEKMTLEQIDKLTDPTVKAIALQEYKATLMSAKGQVFGNDTAPFVANLQAKDESPKMTAEQERKAYYRETLNPHKNKNFKDECVELASVIDFDY